MAYNRWRNGCSCTAYRGVWRPTPSTELYHYGIKGMKWRHHIRNPFKEAADRFGYTAYKEYKQAKSDERKAFEYYDRVSMGSLSQAKDDESKRARQKWEDADFWRREAYKKYASTPMYKVQKKIEKGKQLVRDIISSFKKFRG